MIQASFRPEDRGKAIGTWSGLGGIASALGPFAGGWLVQYASWRWAFLVNVPLGVATVWIAQLHVPETRDEDADTRFDVAGAALATLALGITTFALIEHEALGVGPALAVGALGSRWVRPSSSSSDAPPTRWCSRRSSPPDSSAPPTP